MRPKLMDWEGERLPKIDEIWMLPRIKNSLKNRWFWKPTLKNIVTKTLPKTMYFSHAFLNGFWRVLGRVLGVFWEGFGRSLASLGPLFGVFFQGFVAKRAQEGPRGGQEVSWARFRRVSDGFWEGFGRPKWSKYRDFWYFLDMLFETLILIEFCLIFDNFGRGDGEKHLFPHGGLLMLVEGFGSKTRCLQVA